VSTRWPTLIEDGDGLLILDQTCLPREAVMLRLATLDDVVKAIAPCRCAARR
jgi:methylthioribose-1-phosphate isomerase